MTTFGHSINGILISPLSAHRHPNLSAIAVPLRRPRSPSGALSTSKPYTSFFIRDILGSKLGQPITLSAAHHHHHHHHDVLSSRSTCSSTRSVANNFSPWSPRPTAVRSPLPITPPSSTPTPTPNNIRPSGFTKQALAAAATKKTGSSKQQQQQGDSPLSALEELANKTFTGLETSILRAAEATTSGKRDPLHLFNRQPPRKKRKSRTAFTNQQIFELERRFLYQKYLTPADRDEIATTLGLSNAQVITWFQNRRAKLKRDMEELKADVVATADPDAIPTTCLKVSIMDESSVRGLTTTAETAEETRKDSQGNEEPLMTTSEMLDNQRVELSNETLGEHLMSSNSSSEHATNTIDDMSSRDSSVISRDSSVTSRDSESSVSCDSGIDRLHHDTDGCDDVEAMDCSTSPCSDHSDEESEE